MAKLITIEDVLTDFSYEGTDELKRLISSYLDLTTEQLSMWVGTPLARASYTDHFWYDPSSRANALPYCQFNLTAGFVQGAVAVTHAPTLEAVKAGGSPVDSSVLKVNDEQGTVRIMDGGLNPMSYYQITYEAGFTTQAYVVTGICNSVLYLSTPDWLKVSARILTSQLVRDHYAPNSRSKQVDQRLNDILHLKARRFGPSCRPL